MFMLSFHVNCFIIAHDMSDDGGGGGGGVR